MYIVFLDVLQQCLIIYYPYMFNLCPYFLYLYIWDCVRISQVKRGWEWESVAPATVSAVSEEKYSLNLRSKQENI